MFFALLSSLISLLFAPSRSTTGWGTVYGGNDNGNACGYSHVPSSSFPFGLYAACGGSIYNNGYGCGKCYRVTCTGPKDTSRTDCFCDSSTPSATIQCMDWCPECDGTHFDFNEAAMDLIVTDGTGYQCGEIAVTYERVDCAYTGNVKIRSKSGTSATWYGLHVDDVAGAGSIASVAIRSNDASSFSVTCDKSGGASFFLCNLNGAAIAAPLDVRLTNDYGQSIECIDCITNLNGDIEFDFGSNFPGIDGSVSTGDSTATTTTTTSGGSGSSTYMQIASDSANSDWYLSINLLNADGSSCGRTVTGVSIYYNNAWQSADQNYGVRYAWNHFGFAFSQMLPISLRVSTTSDNIDLWGVMTTIDKSTVFTTSRMMCDGAFIIDEELQNADTRTTAIIVAASLLFVASLVISGFVVYALHVKKKRAQMNKVTDEVADESDAEDGNPDAQQDVDTKIALNNE
eukprot:CAMPEP_0202702358 /NCGR_PEP_ID=MMETSP1385-20130828/15360_1 /ASSEMBLY_ACC=CAM_ASM_000861 /TAXON_ID=933848 /ORGANISM="Elphidium margaritaceum" /LENGTH=457 /DNA_ID=CAMNT_0049359995 /DNA_START=45 /DNA_END=1418 /DNA_ORIENTATION=-